MDTVELKSAVTPPDKGASEAPEVVVQPQRGGTSTVTLNTEQAKKQPEQKQADRPSWLPGDFKTPEEFADAYKAMAGKLAPPEQKPPEDRKGAEEVLQKSGLDMAEFSTEYAKDGKLSDASIAKLEKAGIKKATAEAFIEGQKARANEYKSQLAKVVGGEDALQETLKWAEGSLSPAEIKAANAALTSMDPAQAGLVLSGLNARRIAEHGVEPELVRGRAASSNSEPGYESTAQWVSDVNSHLYKTDPAFRQKVQRRVAASKF